MFKNSDFWFNQFPIGENVVYFNIQHLRDLAAQEYYEEERSMMEYFEIASFDGYFIKEKLKNWSVYEVILRDISKREI